MFANLRFHRSVLLAVALLVLFAGVRPTWAKDDGLEAIPGSAALVVRYASFDRAVGGLTDMLNALGPQIANETRGFEQEVFGALIFVKNTNGLIDRGAPVYAFGFARVDIQNPAGVVLKTKDLEKLQRALLGIDSNAPLTKTQNGDIETVSGPDGRSYYFRKFKDWVVYTHNENAAKLLTFDPAKDPSFAALIDDRADKVVGTGDLAFMFNPRPVIENLKPMLDEARKEIEQGINSIPDSAFMGTPYDGKFVRAVLHELVKRGFEVLPEVTYVVGRVNFSAAGFSAEVLTGVQPGGKLDQFFASHPADPFELVGILPAGASMYFGAHQDYARIAEELASFLKSIPNQPQDVLKGLESMRKFAEAKASTSVSSMSFPGTNKAGIVSHGLQIAENPDALRQIAADSVSGYATINVPNMQMTPEFKAGVENYKGHVIDMMSILFTAKGNTDMETQILDAVFKKFFGGNRIQTRVTTLEGMIATTMGADEKLIQTLIDRMESGQGILGVDVAYSKARDELGQSANFLFLINVPQFMIEVLNSFKGIPQLEQLLQLVPFNLGFQPSSSYAGFTLGTEEHGLRARVYIPIEQPKGVIQILGSIISR